MANRIHVQIEAPFQAVIEAKLIRAAVRAVLKHQGVPPPTALTVRVTTDVVLQQLNRDFLGHDHPTDVLSFPADEIDPETQTRYLGDIALSLPRAQAQAQQGGHPLRAEVQLLVVHGVLHLLGHDHAEAEAKARMWQAQAEILTKLKAPLTGPKT